MNGSKMQWTSLNDFLHMGGYGLYVWGSYGLTLAVMAGEALLARRRHHQARAHARDHAGMTEAA